MVSSLLPYQTMLSGGRASWEQHVLVQTVLGSADTVVYTKQLTNGSG